LKLPVLSGREAAKVFERLEWEIARQRGSHIILIKEGHIVTLSIPRPQRSCKGDVKEINHSCWRNSRGVSKSNEVNSLVEGIGEGTFEKIKDYITVSD